MDFIFLLLLIVVSVLFGVVLTVSVQWYLLNVYIMRKPYIGPNTEPFHEPISLPKNFTENTTLGKESAGAINALLQFLFQELRCTKRVRRWFRQRLTLEFEELLTRTTTGKLFEKIVLRDLHLGSHLPAIQSVEVKALNYDPIFKTIDDVELSLDLEYSGGFQLSIDASMRLSKAAHVSVKVNELKGQGRLMFSRTPYTHWSFSFYTDPLVNLSVESQFQGRSLPQVNSIIANQIRKAVKRKHTLPYYKIRYKPFFVRPEPDTSDDVGDPYPGKLEVTILEATRITENSASIFCNIAIDSSAWIEMIHSATASYLSVDIMISKSTSLNFCASFKQEFVPDKYQVCIVVDSVQCPSSVDLKVGDIITMVDGRDVTSVSVLNRIIKNNSVNHTIRIERRLKSIVLNDDKLASLDASGLRHRRGSAEKTDSDSSNPPSSSDSPAKRSQKGSPEHLINRSSLSTEPEIDFLRPQLQSTQDLPYAKVLPFNEKFKFQVLPEHKYLNLSVWARSEEKNQLLGHMSLPIASYCCPEIVGNRLALLPLLPPSPNLPNCWSDTMGGLNGFEPSLCYGDVLLSFSFTCSGPLPVNCSAPPVTVTTPTPPPTETPPLSPLPPSLISTHDFVRTHFTKATQCGFCFKKIWLKDALQCQGCLMTCHKKCAPKCQSSQPCARTKASNHPEIITTAPTDSDSSAPIMEAVLDGGDGVVDLSAESLLGDSHQTHSAAATSRASIGALIASVAGGIKRTGSASSLAPPHGSGSGGPSISSNLESFNSSASLPPSPNHSPSPSRKTSLVDGCLFAGAEVDEIDQAVSLIMSRPHDDNVMDIAKSSGKLLFAELPPDVRKSRIDQVMNKLKDAMDSESRHHQMLLKEEQVEEELLASESRLQALTILMLHCCAGLQDSQEVSGVSKS